MDPVRLFSLQEMCSLHANFLHTDEGSRLYALLDFSNES